MDREERTELQCSLHHRPLLLRKQYGLVLYLEEDGRDTVICDALNRNIAVAGVVGDEPGVLYLQSSMFKLTPSFRAGFVVSRQVRERVYIYLANETTRDGMVKALRLVVHLARGAYNKDTIYGELYGIFGKYVVQGNIREACGVGILIPDVQELPMGAKWPLLDLTQQSISGVQQDLSELKRLADERERIAREYAEKKYH